jgi:phospholipid transport system substrate-binding protein
MTPTRLSRRCLSLTLAGALLLAVPAVPRAQDAAPAATPAAAVAPVAAPKKIEAYYDVLLDTMKQAKALGIKGRYAKLEPAIRAAFDLPAMTRIAVGPAWTQIPAEQQAALVEAFSHMTIATYAARFDGYDGEKFVVDPTPEVRGADRIVKTQLLPTGDAPVTLNYLMRGKDGADWKVVDVYLSGTISELATRRSEFTALLKSGGPEALLSNLKQRTADLLAGAAG